MEKIRDDFDLKNSSYESAIIENKVMLHLIYKVYLSLNKDDLVNLCWCELTLNK